MTDLVDFLNERWAELQATALDASTSNGREWTSHYQPIDNALITGDLDGPFSNVVAFDEGAPNEWQAAHIALNDPASVLRRVAAERKLAALHVPVPCPDHDDLLRLPVCKYCEWEWPCQHIELLAEGHGWTDEA